MKLSPVEFGGRSRLGASLDHLSVVKGGRDPRRMAYPLAEMHRVLDVVLHDDLASLRTAMAPKNISVVKHLA